MSSPSRFGWRVGGIAVAATVGRAGAAAFLDERTDITGDATWYLGVARLVARGAGFVEPLSYELGHREVATSSHPPLYALYLSVPDLVGLHSTLVHRLWSSIPGITSVVLIAVLARRLAGDRAGVAAAAAAAVSLSLTIQDVRLWSEGFYGCTLLLVVWLAYRYDDRPATARIAWLGLGVALCALTRAEGALLLVVLVVPLVITKLPGWQQRIRALAVAVAVMAITVVPWAGYNASRFHQRVVLSDGFGGLLASSNCDATYTGPGIGAWGFLCGRAFRSSVGSDESDIEVTMRRAGIEYIGDHLDRLPSVIAVRLMRTFGSWDPVRNADRDLGLGEAGIPAVAWVVVAQYWLYVALGAVGLMSLIRRRVSVLPLAAPVAVAAVITVIGYGTLRFRIGLEVVLPILVGIGVARLLDGRLRALPPGSGKGDGGATTMGGLTSH